MTTRADRRRVQTAAFCVRVCVQTATGMVASNKQCYARTLKIESCFTVIVKLEERKETIIAAIRLV